MENRHLLGSITIFIVLAFIASTTLFIALILWLAELVGSLIVAMTLVGCFTLLLSLFVYFVSVRPSVKLIEQQVQKIYEVSEALHQGYLWVVKMVGAMLR